LIARASSLSARFHVALDYEDIVVSRIVNEVAGIEPTLPPYNLGRMRYRAAKRTFDFVVSLFLLTAGLPAVYLSTRGFRSALKKLWGAFTGKYSIIGLYPLDDEEYPVMGKIGLTGLAHISKPSRLSPQVIRELNEYYVQQYTLTLDFDILFKGLFRKSNGS
jgi:lipopolysaccharide/colanic/teichoic acid biosynthesis glycosyltransferase